MARAPNANVRKLLLHDTRPFRRRRTNHRVTENTEKNTERKRKKPTALGGIFFVVLCGFLCVLCDSVVSSFWGQCVPYQPTDAIPPARAPNRRPADYFRESPARRGSRPRRCR